jgi:hypothetical protein
MNLVNISISKLASTIGEKERPSNTLEMKTGRKLKLKPKPYNIIIVKDGHNLESAKELSKQVIWVTNQAGEKYPGVTKRFDNQQTKRWIKRHSIPCAVKKELALILEKHNGEIPSYGSIRGLLALRTGRTPSIRACQKLCVSILRAEVTKAQRQYINQQVLICVESRPQQIHNVVEFLSAQPILHNLSKFVVRLYAKAALTRYHARLTSKMPLEDESRSTILTPKMVKDICAEILSTPHPELNGDTLATFFDEHGGYIGKTVRCNIEDEAYKRLSSSYRSKKTGRLTAPLLDASGHRLTEKNLKLYGFQAITLYQTDSIINMELIEHALQTSLQHYPLGKRLWSFPSSAGRRPLTYDQCRVYYSFCRDLPSLLETEILQVNHL